MSELFTPLSIRSVTLKNRIAVSPMCEYSAEDGAPNDWHMVHLGSRAVGGAGLVMTEATAVEPAGRITPYDTGLYDNKTQGAWTPIVDFIKRQGAVAGIQLAHAGRKASTDSPWVTGKHLTVDRGGWSPIYAPSAEPFAEGYGTPVEMSEAEIKSTVQNFKLSAARALEVGFQVIELHGAHGYLLNEFLSPLSNKRIDPYGGSFENRTRFLVEIIHSVREVWPERLPLFLRISSVDWVEGGWTIEDSVQLAKLVGPLGVDLMDCSSGGNTPTAKIPVGPGYQVPFAKRIKAEANILTGAVGMIVDPGQAEKIIADGEADLVLLAREMLRDPYFPRRAAKELGAEITSPVQYGRAW